MPALNGVKLKNTQMQLSISNFYITEPDLILVGLPDSTRGYVFSQECDHSAANLEEAIQRMAYLDDLLEAEKSQNPDAKKVIVTNLSVYESDGKTIIGSWPIEYQPAVKIAPGRWHL